MKKTEAWANYTGDWLTLITDQDLANLDISWMTSLAQYNHWTILEASDLRPQRARSTPAYFFYKRSSK